MTDKVSSDAAKNGLLHKLLTHIAKSATPREIADMLGDAVVKAEASPLSEEIDDNWTGSEATKVGPNFEIGGGVKAKGNEPSDIIRTYSPDQAAQFGATEAATKLGLMVNGLKEVRKSLAALTDDHLLMKSILIKLAKAEPEKDTKDEMKEEKTDKDDEFSKAVAAVVAKAQPFIDLAKERIETAKSMAAEGFAFEAANAKSGAAEFIVKARKLIEAAKSMDPTNPKVIAISKAADDVKDEFGNATKDEVTKSDVADDKKDDMKDDEKEAAKAVNMFAPEHIARFEQAASELNIAKATMHQLMDKIAGRPAEIAKSKPEITAIGAATSMEGIQAIIRQKSDSGELSSIEASGAMDLSALHEADVKGMIPKGLFDAKLAVMPAAVKAIFNVAA